MVAVLLLSFFAVAALVIVTPGQDTALTIRNTLRGGRRDGVLTACGVAAGQLVWAVASSAGLAALLVASEPAFHALRLLGAAYLIYLGLDSLWRAARGRAASNTVLLGKPRPFRQGLLSNLANPKMAVFFSSLLPQFASSFAGLLALGVLFAAMTLTWLSLVARAGELLRRPRLRRAVDAFVGAVLTAFGIKLAR